MRMMGAGDSDIARLFLWQKFRFCSLKKSQKSGRVKAHRGKWCENTDGLITE